MKEKEKFIEFLVNHFGAGVYCDTCRGTQDDVEEGFCSECHRKAMGWEPSRYFLEEIADKASELFSSEKHAHWVFAEKDRQYVENGMLPYNMWCSYCGQWSDSDCYGDAYCGNCGARLDEKDDLDIYAENHMK